MSVVLIIFLAGALCGYGWNCYLGRRALHIVKSHDTKKLEAYVQSDGLWADMVRAIHAGFDEAKGLRERLKAEQHNMQRFIAGSRESVIILDNKGRLLHYNTKGRELFSIDNTKKNRYLNEIIRSPDVIKIFQQCVKSGKLFTDHCSFNIREPYFRSFKVVAVPFFQTFSVKNGEDSFFPEQEGEAEDKQSSHVLSGHTGEVHEGKSLESGEGGMPDGMALLFYDETGMKVARRQHIDFVSNVSHELKTPLTAMQGFVEVLIQDLGQKKLDQFEKFLNILLRNCRRIGHLVDDLLHLSNLSASDRVNKEVFGTREITESVLEHYKYPDHQIQCEFLAEEVWANRRWLEIILRNLIDNAARHTPKGDGVYVRWEKEGTQVLLKVSDDGEGVPEKYHQRIFERFFRMDSARSREKGGAGVGLALVKQSMEKQGGQVRVVSSKNGGAEFICAFPVSSGDI